MLFRSQRSYPAAADTIVGPVVSKAQWNSIQGYINKGIEEGATLVGGGYVQLRSEGWEFILAPEARDTQNAALASPLRLKGGSGRTTAAALDPGLTRLIVPAGAVPSLVAQVTQASRQSGVNPCSVAAPRVEGLRPGLRAQLPVPPVERARSARSPTHSSAPPAPSR